MKHLKRFNEDIDDPFSEEAVKEVFESYINWNMIHDAKDLALELLDNGFRLNIEVDYFIARFNERPDLEIPIYTIRYSHGSENSSFDHFTVHNQVGLSGGVYSLEPVDVELITYNIYFTSVSLIHSRFLSETEEIDEINRLEDIFKSELEDRYPQMKKYMTVNK